MSSFVSLAFQVQHIPSHYFHHYDMQVNKLIERESRTWEKEREFYYSITYKSYHMKKSFWWWVSKIFTETETNSTWKYLDTFACKKLLEICQLQISHQNGFVSWRSWWKRTQGKHVIGPSYFRINPCYLVVTQLSVVLRFQRT